MTVKIKTQRGGYIFIQLEDISTKTSVKFYVKGLYQDPTNNDPSYVIGYLEDSSEDGFAHKSATQKILYNNVQSVLRGHKLEKYDHHEGFTDISSRYNLKKYIDVPAIIQKPEVLLRKALEQNKPFVIVNEKSYYVLTRIEPSPNVSNVQHSTLSDLIVCYDNISQCNSGLLKTLCSAIYNNNDPKKLQLLAFEFYWYSKSKHSGGFLGKVANFFKGKTPEQPMPEINFYLYQGDGIYSKSENDIVYTNQVPQNAGGFKKTQEKVSFTKKNNKSITRIVYKGPRGAKYVILNKQFMRLSEAKKLLTPTQRAQDHRTH